MTLSLVNNADSGLSARTKINAGLTGYNNLVLSVKDFGATGNGSTNDTAAIQACLDAAFGTSGSPHGASANLNSAVYFPAGTYIVSGNPALTVTAVRGGLIFGEGMLSSIISGTTNAGVTFLLNGFGFSTIRDLTIQCSGTGAVVALDYDWDGSVAQSSQSSLFQNCGIFGNPGSKNASAIGCRLGKSNFQTDTSTFLNCFFGNANHGLSSQTNFNCIGHTVVGGQFQSNNYGINVAVGGVETIHGAFFAVNATYDISLSGGALNAYSITGCRSESANFLQVSSNSIIAHVHGVDHAATTLGHFVASGTAVHIDGCWSALGDVYMNPGGSTTGNMTISDSVFSRFDGIAALSTSIWSTATIRNVYLGDQRTGIGRYIIRQNIVRNVIRTFDVEATALTDLQVLYDNYNNAVAQIYIGNTLPTTIGTSPTFSVASPTVVTNSSAFTYFQGGESVAFSLVSTGTLPTGITSGRTYFVTKDSLTNSMGTQLTYHLSTTQALALAGTADVNVSGSGSGNIHTWAVRRWAVGDTILKSDVAAAGSSGWICTTAGWGSTVAAGETQAVFKALPNVAA